METVKDTPGPTTTAEEVKSNITSDETAVLVSEVVSDGDPCQKSNGVAETSDITESDLDPKDAAASEIQSVSDAQVDTTLTDTEPVIYESVPEECTEVVTAKPVAEALPLSIAAPDPERVETVDATHIAVVETEQLNLKEPNEPENKDTTNETPTVESNDIEIFHNDNVTFETEVLVETNDNDVNELNLNDTKTDTPVQESTNNILNELGKNLELSEALRSSNTENGENNNHTVGQEVFNKEELLDILEGNDVPLNYEIDYEVNIPSAKTLETQLALQQLSRLKNKKKKPKTVDMGSKKKAPVKQKSESQNNTEISNKDKDDSIVNVLVKDWDDDELGEDEQTENLKEKGDQLLKSSETLIKTQESTTSAEVTPGRTSVDSTGDTPNLNKTNDDNQPQRRLGRVIKKKVIFDPDNPDTFTKSKTPNKSKDSLVDKEEPPHKKGKPEQVAHRAKSKSPVSKMQWKKPPPKNIKQNKRLTEVDKLLMDEGAVNMIYQLTPEAQKGKKNMKTKAEFIKKLQSSTPESKEMKFRERKKECGKEEGEAKKILGSKPRTSLSSSVKSPTACDDFETHSADDSIIYRRHSSSSYSSTCMSPRRLSDVEAGANQSAHSKALIKTDVPDHEATLEDSPNKSSEVFMADMKNSPSSDIINKNDCLSIKEKLNSKLSLALNKRKREPSKTDKPVKQKKIFKSEDKSKLREDTYKYLTVVFNQRVAEICIRASGSLHCVEVCILVLKFL